MEKGDGLKGMWGDEEKKEKKSVREREREREKKWSERTWRYEPTDNFGFISH